MDVRAEDSHGFTLRDCAFTALATGEEARNLREFRDRVARVPEGTLYYHFWGRLLRPVFAAREHVNDFGNWVGHELRDPVAAEKLALVDPADFADLEEVRSHVLEVLEERIAQGEWSPQVSSARAFHFLKGKIVVFDTGRRITDPQDLPGVIPELPPSSIYYHFVDARARHRDGADDFQRWLSAQGEDYRSLVTALAAVDLYYTSLEDLQQELTTLFSQYFGLEAER